VRSAARSLRVAASGRTRARSSRASCRVLRGHPHSANARHRRVSARPREMALRSVASLSEVHRCWRLPLLAAHLGSFSEAATTRWRQYPVPQLPTRRHVCGSCGKTVTFGGSPSLGNDSDASFRPAIADPVHRRTRSRRSGFCLSVGAATSQRGSAWHCARSAFSNSTQSSRAPAVSFPAAECRSIVPRWIGCSRHGTLIASRRSVSSIERYGA
jgi:hypothetical protein